MPRLAMWNLFVAARLCVALWQSPLTLPPFEAAADGTELYYLNPAGATWRRL